jgi:hypothetical protein
VTLANQAHCACLRALVALLLDETDFRADGQALEIPIDDGVTVKVDFTTVDRFDESVIFPSHEFRNSAMALPDVLLYLTTHMALHVFDLTHRCVESLPDRDQNVLALGRVAVRLIDYDVVMFGQ